VTELWEKKWAREGTGTDATVYGASFVDNENILESESNDSPQF
jgi:hypothetical protein